MVVLTGLVPGLAVRLHFQVPTWSLSSWGLNGSLIPQKLPWAMGVAGTTVARSLVLCERCLGFRSLLGLLVVSRAQVGWGPVFMGALWELWESPGTTEAPVPGRARSLGSQEALGSLVLLELLSC